MLHLAITKSTTTLLKKTTKNITKDVAFGYYQKYNNITKKYNITLKMLHLAITKSTTTTIYSKH